MASTPFHCTDSTPAASPIETFFRASSGATGALYTISIDHQTTPERHQLSPKHDAIQKLSDATQMLNLSDLAGKTHRSMGVTRTRRKVVSAPTELPHVFI